VELTTDPPPVAAGSDVPDVDALVQRALDARPELKAAQWRAASVDEEKRAAESTFWPQLDAGALAQVGNNPLIAGVGSHEIAASPIPFAGSNAVIQGGVTLSINLFDTWTTTHNIEDAAHRRRLADADVRSARRQVENDVRIAHAHVVSLRAQHEALVKAKTIEADDVGILQHAYERGEVLLTELLDEQLRLADVTRQIIDVDAQAAVAQIELDSAVGNDSFGSFGVSP
jgi:outer membrane protein TolC